MKAKRLISTARAHSRELLRELGDLVVPLACAGCGKYGQSLCTECWLDWQIGAMRVEEHVPAFGDRAQIPIWAAGVYDDAVRQTIVSIKERGRGDVLNLISGAAMRIAQRIGPHLAQLTPALHVVPVPPRKPQWLSGRALSVPQFFATSVVEHLTRWKVDASEADLLRHHRFTRDQVGLGRAQRLQNRGGTMRIASTGIDLAARPVLVVDDVVTTGATLREAIGELTRGGATVIGAIVLAATPRRNPLPDVDQKI